MKASFKLCGLWTFVCKDKNGNTKWIECCKNRVVNEGLNHLLNIVLHGDTPITAWYVAPFESDTTILATHTYAVPGYTECTAYDEANRQAYVEAAASGQSITNSANKATITISATKTLYGAAFVGGGSAAATKGDAAGGGTLFCAVKFTNARTMYDDDTLEMTYTLTAADDGV